MSEVNATEVALTMHLTKEILGVATSLNNAQIGTASLIMATAISGLAAGISLEDFKATIEKSVDEVYADAMSKKEALN